VTALAKLDEEETMVERRSIATGAVRPISQLVRFVVGPEGDVVADIEGKLPGRGMWVEAERKAIAAALAKNAFAKAAKQPVKVAPDLGARVEALLARRLAATLGLAKRAGQLVQGHDNVIRALDARQPPRVLVEASNAAADGRRKLKGAARSRDVSVEIVDCLTGAELSLALGLQNVIHAAVKPGPLAERLIADGLRLKGLRANSGSGDTKEKHE